MSDVDRRRLLQWLAATPAAALAFTWTSDDVAYAYDRSVRARADALAAQQPYTPRFLTAPEYATLTALADLILPRDERSGSASDAGVPAFIDYIVAEQPERQTAMRGGLAWLDAECLARFDKRFLDCADAERTQVLDDVAYPERARPEFSHGVQFFTTVRDLVAAGFWSSRIGVDDIGYLGNRPTIWTGAPDEVLQKLGVRYED